MSAFWRQLRSRRKLLTIWGLFGGLALCRWLAKNAGLKRVDDYERLAQAALLYVEWSVVVIIPIVLFSFLSSRRRARRFPPDKSFRSQPKDFDRKTIRIAGRVSRIFVESKKNQRPQRFLLSSPQLSRGERLLVENDKGIYVRRGLWIELQGQYRHVPGRVPRRFGIGTRLSKYGLLSGIRPPADLVNPGMLDQSMTLQQVVPMPASNSSGPDRPPRDYAPPGQSPVERTPIDRRQESFGPPAGASTEPVAPVREAPPHARSPEQTRPPERDQPVRGQPVRGLPPLEFSFGTGRASREPNASVSSPGAPSPSRRTARVDPES